MVLILGCTSSKPIGEAKMDQARVLQVWLRAELPEGGHGDVFIRITPDDKNYQKWLKHLGGIEPGESKLVPPWPDELSE